MEYMKPLGRILVIDDEPDHLEMCADILGSKGHKCVTTTDPKDALTLINSNVPNVVVVDLKMPKMDGLNFLKKANSCWPDLPIIVLTAFVSIEKTVEAIKLGAFDFLNKPIKADELLSRVDRAIHRALSHPQRDSYPFAHHTDNGCYNLIGSSQVMKQIYSRIRNVSTYDVNVFIYGESGTGKELTAEAIHKLSKRAKAPFVPIDCAAISESLIDSELFGHERGAFTGAVSQKKGLLEMANGGIVFLDEITELKPELQSKFLRVLERGHIRRVRGLDLIDLDIRIIAATNRNPWKAIEEDRLREDLFYRLNGILINLPPLRIRDGDLELLSSYFLKQMALSEGEAIKELSQDALAVLKKYSWPGNVRELYKLMEQLHVMTRGTRVTIEDLPSHLFNSREPEAEKISYDLPYKKAEEYYLKEFRKKYLSKLLERHHGNISRAARDAGLDRTTIYRWLKGNG